MRFTYDYGSIHSNLTRKTCCVLRLRNAVTRRCPVKAGVTHERQAADVGSRQHMATVVPRMISGLKMDVPAAGDAIDRIFIIQRLAANVASFPHDKLLSVLTR
jgi:hypothetical protein